MSLLPSNLKRSNPSGCETPIEKAEPPSPSETPQKRKIRDSNIEILRVITMMTVVFHHFSVHGQVTHLPTECDSLSKVWLVFLLYGGAVGVNVFVLITGYFLITAKGPLIPIKKTIKFVGELLFYAIVIHLFLLLFKCGEYQITSFSSLVHAFSPFRWWFAVAYLVLYILHPLINRLFKGKTQHQFQQILLAAFAFFYLFPKIVYWRGYGPILWLIFLYAIAGYIRLFGEMPFLRQLKTLKQLAVVGIPLFFLPFILEISGIYFFHEDFLYWKQYNVLILLPSIIVFYAFTKIKMKGNRWINILAMATFGVYLLHDHPDIRSVLWKEIFEAPYFYNLDLLIPYTILVVVFVYFLFTAIDLLRIYFVEQPFMSLVNRCGDYCARVWEKVSSAIRHSMFKKPQ